MNRLSPAVATLALFVACATPPTDPEAAPIKGDAQPNAHNASSNKVEAAAAETKAPRSASPVYEFLAANYDANQDGSVTEEEYGRGARAFRNLDKNRDGVVTADDWKRNRRGGRTARGNSSVTAEQRLVRQRRFIEMFASFLNVDGEAGIGVDEWRKWAASMPVNDDGVIAGDDLGAFLGSAKDGRMARMATRSLRRDLDTDGNGDVTRSDLASMFAAVDTDGDQVLGRGDELRMPPGRGEMAPDFTLAYADNRPRKVTLSSYRGKKPVALIFGSYT